MQNALFRCGLVLAALVAIPLSASGAVAGGVPGYAAGSIALSCDNGRVYPFRIRAVSYYGEIVTGYLSTSPRRSVHVRLIPMGDGYRYAGRGLWFDGKDDLAVLYFDKHRSVNCIVLRDGAVDGAPVVVKG